MCGVALAILQTPDQFGRLVLVSSLVFVLEATDHGILRRDNDKFAAYESLINADHIFAAFGEYVVNAVETFFTGRDLSEPVSTAGNSALIII